MKKKIAIIGAGISGLTFANLLKKSSKYDFTIFEKNSSLNLKEGYGIQLSVNSISILNKINFQELKFENKSQHETLFVDGRRIRQVLLNLLSNAVKFTDEGHISLRVDDVPGEEMIRFRVEDSGIGISSEDQEKLFQPFFQVDHGLSRKYQGTGLGLAITWRTVELHDGQIELESVPGKGSCFSVILPVKAEKAAVIRALARAGNNVSQAARQLGIGRATLYRRMKRLGLEDS